MRGETYKHLFRSETCYCGCSTTVCSQGITISVFMSEFPTEWNIWMSKFVDDAQVGAAVTNLSDHVLYKSSRIPCAIGSKQKKRCF